MADRPAGDDAGRGEARRRRLQAMGPRCVLLTSLDVAEGEIGLLAAEGGRFWRLSTPLLPLSVNGAGDAIAALFLFHRLRSGEAGTALAAAGASVFGILRRTAELGARELQLVAAQDELVRPSRSFASEAV
jgi:pyridoxine kinase